MCTRNDYARGLPLDSYETKEVATTILEIWNNFSTFNENKARHLQFVEDGTLMKLCRFMLTQEDANCTVPLTICIAASVEPDVAEMIAKRTEYMAVFMQHVLSGSLENSDLATQVLCNLTRKSRLGLDNFILCMNFPVTYFRNLIDRYMDDFAPDKSSHIPMLLCNISQRYHMKTLFFALKFHEFHPLLATYFQSYHRVVRFGIMGLLRNLTFVRNIDDNHYRIMCKGVYHYYLLMPLYSPTNKPHMDAPKELRDAATTDVEPDPIIRNMTLEGIYKFLRFTDARLLARASDYYTVLKKFSEWQDNLANNEELVNKETCLDVINVVLMTEDEVWNADLEYGMMIQDEKTNSNDLTKKDTVKRIYPYEEKVPTPENDTGCGDKSCVSRCCRRRNKTYQANLERRLAKAEWESCNKHEPFPEPEIVPESESSDSSSDPHADWF